MLLCCRYRVALWHTLAYMLGGRERATAGISPPGFYMLDILVHFLLLWKKHGTNRGEKVCNYVHLHNTTFQYYKDGQMAKLHREKCLLTCFSRHGWMVGMRWEHEGEEGSSASHHQLAFWQLAMQTHQHTGRKC